VIAAILIMAILAGTIAAALSIASVRLGGGGTSAVERINDLLPQTQCGQCQYPGCRAYAEAIVNGAAGINQCAPGGEATILAIGRLLDRPPVPPDPQFGKAVPPQVAVIAEAACIGCAACLQACPVDAILGAPQYMHTIITAECTGCELCIAPCPVDCITLESR
jgi:electron transport complex protein RnfB